MTSRRVLKVAESVREVVGMAILADLNDPRIQGVTVIRAEVSGDLRLAKVYVSIMGDEKAQKLCLHGLRSSAGFLQAKIAQRINTRYTPKLTFILDQGIKHSIEISRILSKVLPSDQKEDSAPAFAVEDENDAEDSDVLETTENETLEPGDPPPEE